MMKALFKNEWRIMMNTIRTAPTRNIFAYLITFMVVGIFLYIILGFVLGLADKIPLSIFEGLLSYGLLTLIGAVILLGLPYVFKNLYASADLELLFTMPIPTRIVFWVKYSQSFLQVCLPILFFLGLPIVGYGVTTGVHFLYYPVLLIILVAVGLIGLSITYLANLLVVQIVPASKANEFLTGMSFLTGALVYIVLMIPNFKSDLSVTDMILSGVPVFPSWVPVAWGSSAVVAAGQGSLDFILPLVLIVGLSALLLFIASMTVEKGFRTGWIRVSEGSSKKKKRKRRKHRKAVLHHPVIAIGKKEWLAIKRDTREWVVFMPIVIFITFLVIGFFTNGARFSELRSYSEISWPVAQGIILFMFTMFNGTMAAFSVGREGVSAWNLNILPLPGRIIAVGKLWISWLIPFILLTGIEVVGGLLLNWSVMQMVMGIVIKAVITLGMSAIGLWFGTFGAKYNPMNPQMRLKFGASIFLFVLSIVYLIALAIPYTFIVFPVDEVPLPDPTSHGAPGVPGLFLTIVLGFLNFKQAYPVVVNSLLVVVMIAISVGITIAAIAASAKRFEKGIKIDLVSETRSSALWGSKAK